MSRHLIAAAAAALVAYAVWALLDYLMPPGGCAVYEAVTASIASCPGPSAASLLHGLAAVLTGVLVVHGAIKVWSLWRKRKG